MWRRKSQRRVKVKIIDNEVYIRGLTLRDLLDMLKNLRDVEIEIQVIPKS